MMSCDKMEAIHNARLTPAWYMELALRCGPYSSRSFLSTDDHFMSTDVSLGLSLLDREEWELEEKVEAQVESVMALNAKAKLNCPKKERRHRLGR